MISDPLPLCTYIHFIHFHIYSHSPPLQDTKLVDGVAGETLIYRRRGHPEKQSGLVQEKPKRVQFVLDLSNSMVGLAYERNHSLLIVCSSHEPVGSYLLTESHNTYRTITLGITQPFIPSLPRPFNSIHLFAATTLLTYTPQSSTPYSSLLSPNLRSPTPLPSPPIQARGNAWDRRLDRQCESAVLIMEALTGFEHKFKYGMVGHSGRSHRHPLIESDDGAPSTATDRMDIIRQMRGTAGGATSGDSTLLATERAVREVLEEADEVDDRIVIVVSDGNLGRYGITPEELTAAMQIDPSVQCYLIFIAEAGAAEWLVSQLPLQSAYACMDLESLPSTLKDIFAHAANRE